MESTTTFTGGNARYLPFDPERDTIVLALKVSDYDEDVTEEWVVAWRWADEPTRVFATRVGDAGIYSPSWEQHPDAPLVEVVSVYDWAAAMQTLIDEIDEHSYGRNTDAERTRVAQAWPAEKAR